MNRRTAARLALGAVVLAGAAAMLLTRDQIDPAALEAALRGLGSWAPAAFVGAFALATVLFVPGSLFGLAGGVLFGPVWGTFWNISGGTLGATLAFLVARYVAGNWTAKLAGSRLRAVIDGVDAQGWRFVALTRLVPVLPFNVLNYVLGLTRIPFAQYVLATLVCMLPGAAAYAWLGHAGRAAIAGNREAVSYGFLALAVLALIAFVPGLARRFRAASCGWMSLAELRQRLASETPPVVIDVREPDEFVGPLGHIPVARNIPMAQLAAHIGDIEAQRTCATVIVCKTDKRSSKAAAELRAAGIRDVYVLRGGMEAWRSSAGIETGEVASR